MIRFLLGFNLALCALGIMIVLLAHLTDFTDAAHYWREAQNNQAEWNQCTLKHTILLKQIDHEGLTKRLGLNGQPWLQ